jgi:hypothetical protein
VLAAEGAARAFAFDRAASHYARALEMHAAARQPAPRDLYVRLGEALVNAGRGAEASRAYLDAAKDAPAEEALALRHVASQQLLGAGHIDEGLTLLDSVLAEFGMRITKSRLLAVVIVLVARAWRSVRGLAFSPRRDGGASPRELLRVDACWTATSGLALVDILRGLSMESRGVTLALRSGDRGRIVRALVAEASTTAASGTRVSERTERILARARDLAAELGDPLASTMVDLGRCIAYELEGRFAECIRFGERAERGFSTHGHGFRWEMNTARHQVIFGKMYVGDLVGFAEDARAHLHGAMDRGDRYAEVVMRARCMHLVHLIDGAPDAAYEDVARGLERWTSDGFLLQHFHALIARTETDLYAGAPRRALERIDAAMGPMRRSFLLGCQILLLEMLAQRGRAAATAAREGGPDKPALVSQARRDAKRILAQRAPWAAGIARTILAAAAEADGDSLGARELLSTAASELDASGLALHAASARRALGRLVGGDDGARMASAGERTIAEQGVTDPARLARVLVP